MPHFRSIAALVLALLPLVSCSSTDDAGLSDKERLNLHREYAMKFFSTGDYVQAENQANLGLAIDSSEPELKLIIGWVAIKRGKTDDVLRAEKLFRELAKSGDYRAQIGLGEALERRGVLYWETAQGIESGARSTPSNDPSSRVDKLREDARKYWAESEVDYQKALATKPSAIQAINGLQRVAALRGDHEAALNWSLKLLELSRQELEFWRGDLARPNLSATQEAEIRRLLAGGTKLVLETHMQASTLLVKLGRKREGVEQLDAAAQLDPQRAEIYSRRAQLLMDLGDHANARRDIEQFLKLSPLDVQHPDVQRALDLLSECEVALGKAPQK